MELALPLIGGLLIGLSALSMLFFTGRIAGISGIFRGVLMPSQGDFIWRLAFILGLVAGGLLMGQVMPESFPTESVRSTPMLIAGGLLVGFGTRLGSGCTSGHGVCGIGRLSQRSILATITFITTGAITVFVVRTVFGGSV